jgi:hypothetical protein
MGTSGTMALMAKTLIPIGGVIIPVSTTMTSRIPNQTGS